MVVQNKIRMENAQILFRNFSGTAKPFNIAGNRNFCVLLEESLANALEADGWNVRWLKPRDDQESPQAYLQVAVRYEKKPPKIVMVTRKGKTLLDEESIGILDWAEISNVDLVIVPYNWVMHEGKKNQKTGVKAYAKEMFVTLTEDDFASKYYDVPESTEGAIGDDDDVPIR